MTEMSNLPMTVGEAISNCIEVLKMHGEMVDTGHWQGVSTTGKHEMITQEVINLTFSAQIPENSAKLIVECRPNLPWAEEEFQERVGGDAHNPHESMKDWPWWRGQIDEHMSHTYSERFWPNSVYGQASGERLQGIRYPYGELADVMHLLSKYPHTRQAVLPIFFPEDTGGVHGGRIPCTLFYHMMVRKHKMHLWYSIRSCDAVRHFRDDVYMACRLVQWILDSLRMDAYEFGNPSDQAFWEDVRPGSLCFTAHSFHVHRADYHLL